VAEVTSPAVNSSFDLITVTLAAANGIVVRLNDNGIETRERLLKPLRNPAYVKRDSDPAPATHLFDNDSHRSRGVVRSIHYRDVEMTKLM
jgi:hypothetical protein